VPAPKNPNVASAAAARRRIGDTTAANRLFDSGYLVLSPDELDQMPETVRDQLRTWLARTEFRVPPALRSSSPALPDRP
jgi:hypothetical protein